MTNLKFYILFLSVLALGLFTTTGVTLAQPPGAASGDQAEAEQMQRGQGRTQMDQEERQQMMVQRYKELLGMSDEEWAVIGPYVLKVTTLSSTSSGRSSAMRALMGSRNNMQQRSQTQTQDQGEDQSSSQGQRGRSTTREGQDENLQALQEVLDDENATTDEIKSKLSALRKARETAMQELAVARKELRELLTLRQEAMLVVLGILE